MHTLKSKKTAIQAFLYFMATAVVIAYFFPREGKFRYQFHEGKPWRYGLLTAPSDFPIYKSDAELKAERDSLQARFRPYFRLDDRVAGQALGDLKNDYAERRTMSTPVWQYLTQKLSALYADGIISVQDMERMTSEHRTRLRLLRKNVSSQVDISRFHSEKSAYEMVINEAPESMDKGELRASNFDRYLHPNVTYDAETSDKALEALMQKVTLSTGIVQAGERIVDRGEVVDARTYNILRSLKIVHETKSGGNRRDAITMMGQVILILGIMACCALYFLAFRPELYFKRKNRLFILTCILVPCLLTELCVRYDLVNIYILPFAIIPIVVRTFFDSHSALFTHLITALICSLVAPFPHEFLLLQFMAGVVFIISLKELSQRSQLLRCAFLISLAYMLGYIGLSLYQDGDFNKIDWRMGIYFGINFVLLMFSYVLIYMMEKAFGYVSPITLVELSNINTPLLKKLEEKGLVLRQKTDKDGRQLIVSLTQKGKDLKREIQVVPHQIGSCVDLSPEEGAELKRLLLKVLSNVTES